MPERHPVRMRYQTLEIRKLDIHLRTLRDRQQFSDDQGEAAALGISSAMWPFFGMLWPASQVLAHLVAGIDFKNRRILEVGCGMALPSLVLGMRDADISASDQHPEAGSYLAENIRINKCRPIPFVCEDWAQHTDALGRFDLIIGSDLLYDHNSVDLLSRYIDYHAQPTCEVILMDPGRKQQGRFSTAMERLGYHVETAVPDAAATSDLEVPFTGHVLRCLRR